MNLFELLQGQEMNTKMDLKAIKVSQICDDSRRVEPGSVFFARSGSSRNGSEFIKGASAAGAVAIVVDSATYQVPSHLEIIVEDVSQSLEESLRVFYNNPLNHYKLLAVTGTNGKTTTAYILDQIISNELPNILLGTIENKIGNEVIESKLTTPSMVDFYSYLNQGKKYGCHSVTMELSSHAIEQKRLGNIKLDAAIFTNLSQDHLDYHGDMSKYFQSKLKMFTEHLSEGCTAIINIDDDWSKEMIINIVNPIWTYSIKSSEADISILEDLSSINGIDLNIKTPQGKLHIQSNLIGDFNKQNLLGAVGALLSVGINPKVIQDGLKRLNIPGRLELINCESGQVFVDYAHTPDALKNVLQTLSKIKKGRIITVFGCGGDRDKTKRPLMAEVAEEYSDIVFVTSDNPRTEDPMRIIRDALVGVKNKSNVYAEVDRRLAISQALGTMFQNDIVLVAGKGHEDYQIIGYEKSYFDDREVVRELLGTV